MNKLEQSLIFLIPVLLLVLMALIYSPPPNSHAASEQNVKGVSAAEPPVQSPALPDDSPTDEDMAGVMNIFKALTTFNLGGGVTEGATEATGGATGVGGTPGGTVGSPSGGSTAAVASWASNILQNTTRACICDDNGGNCRIDTVAGNWDRFTTPLSNAGYTTNTYPSNDCSNPGDRLWCADLVIESYRLAGFADFTQERYVPAMRNWFKGGPAGYYFIDYQGEQLSTARLQTVKAGCAIMIGSSSDPDNDRGDHVEIIHQVTVDANGNGSITTDSANSGASHHTLVIDAGVIKPYYKLIVGIGCHQ